MPIDPSLVPALEYELEQARGTKPGGQPPNEARIAAIEEAIRLHKNAGLETADAAPEVETADAPKVSRKKPDTETAGE